MRHSSVVSETSCRTAMRQVQGGHLVCLAMMVLSCWTHQAIGQDRFGGFEPSSLQGGLDRWQGNNWLGAQPTAQWSLGVRGDATETGFLVRQVASGSAAERARLQPDDVIITVEGFQVGQVAGRLYEVNQEINRRADSTGVVRLLLQDGITGKLASVRVQLDGNSQQVSGALLAPQILPPDAMVTVQLENLTKPYMVVRGGHQTLSAGNLRNIPFQIAYDPAYIAASDAYQVRAVVTSGGRDILYSQPVRVLTQGNPSTVQLRLEGIVTTAGATGTSTGYVNYNEYDQRLIQIYRQYLGRTPSDAEFAAYRAQGISANTTLERLPLKLMASQEYFDAQRNNNDYWLTSVFTAIVGRNPKPDEVVLWRQRFAELRQSRSELLRQLKQATF